MIKKIGPLPVTSRRPLENEVAAGGGRLVDDVDTADDVPLVPLAPPVGNSSQAVLAEE